MQNQFKQYLGALPGARSKDKRSVYIDSTDTRERDVVASYMVQHGAHAGLENRAIG